MMNFESLAQQEVEKALNDILPLTVVVGAPGVGKSTTLRNWRPPHALYLTCHPGLGKRSFLQLLASRLRPGVILRNGQHGLFLVRKELLHSGRIVILDDAHRLYKPCLEVIDWLVEQVGIPVVLGGHRSLLAHLRKVPTLETRVERLVEHRRLTRAEVIHAVERFWQLPQRQREDWEDFVWRVTEGRWTLLLRFLERLDNHCQPVLTRGIDLETALADMGCRKAA